jgi:hypothetical protein
MCESGSPEPLTNAIPYDCEPGSRPLSRIVLLRTRSANVEVSFARAENTALMPQLQPEKLKRRLFATVPRTVPAPRDWREMPSSLPTMSVPIIRLCEITTGPPVALTSMPVVEEMLLPAIVIAPFEVSPM